MSVTTRRATVVALAKLNLDLRVLYRRPDRYHELRTVFQTISLGDTLELAFTPGRTTEILLQSDPEIPDNLVRKAAALVMAETGARGRVTLHLCKKVPLGGGLGGGSSDAAAVLLALPVIAGRLIEMPRLIELAASLGSDVPFFLLGGAAAGIGRGTELFPLPAVRQRPGLLAAPGLQVSTAAAYAALGPRLTSESAQNKIVTFQSRLWSLADSCGGHNDFEAPVFAQYPRLASLKQKLLKLGARPALMTGSGSAVFGLFERREQVARAVQSLRGDVQVFPISLVSRSQYRALWWRRLQAHIKEKRWPPLSRYVR